jgi:hypothetical protein
MTANPWLRKILKKFGQDFRLPMNQYEFHSSALDESSGSREHLRESESEKCPSCGTPLETGEAGQESWTHSAETCRLVNLVFMELGVSFEQFIRVQIYTASGPLRGYYTTLYPYTIHISDEAYMQFPEYIIFHETKHLVDCLTKGWSEEGTPDQFARSLCLKYGYRCPPASQHYDIALFNRTLNENAVWF